MSATERAIQRGGMSNVSRIERRPGPSGVSRSTYPDAWIERRGAPPPGGDELRAWIEANLAADEDAQRHGVQVSWLRERRS